MEKYYMQFEYQGTIPYAGNPDLVQNQMSILETPLKSHEALSGFSAENDMLIGTFADKEGTALWSRTTAIPVLIKKTR